MAGESREQRTTSVASTLRPDTLLGSVLVILAVNILQRSIGFGRGVLFCRWLDPESLGRWEMAYGFLLLAAPVAVLGLPGSFGRYLERFRQRGHLSVFLHRTAAWTILLGSAAVALIVWRRTDFAQLVFGDSSRHVLVVVLGVVLAAVIADHFLQAVFAGLRLFRVVSAMHFVHSMTFAAVALGLIAWWRPTAESVLIAYGAACLVSVTSVLAWSRRQSFAGVDDVPAPTHRQFWPPLVQFAVWVWVTSLLCNLFAIIDRYMIVHFGGLSADASMIQVANYHASMIVPLLMVSVANLLVGAMTPHLSHDWENGRRNQVSFQLNLSLKMLLVAMTLIGFAVQIVAPLLFEWGFAGKYDGGLAVLHWTVAACVWFGALLVAQVYAWITEQTRRAALPLALGIAANVVLNLMLLPLLGLLGAVIATALATLLALACQLYVNRRLGMTVRAGTLWLAVVPILLTLPPWYAAAGCGLLAVLLSGPGVLVDADEWDAIRTTLAERIGRLSRKRKTMAHG